MATRLAFACVFAGILVISAARSAEPFAPRFQPRPCAGALEGKARCGSVQVPENWDAPGARGLALNVVVLAAREPRPGLPPQFDMEGGPGMPAGLGADFYLSDGQAYFGHRDVVLVDQRGTGGSGALHCPDLAAGEARGEPMYPPRAVTACRRQLERGADLTRYQTTDAVRDIDAVRQALGYSKIDIFALSYGTTLALRYMAAYPGQVRRAVLMSPVPASAAPPSRHASAAERALDLLFADCAADAACHAAYPDPAGDVARARGRLAGVVGAPTAEVFMEELRKLMYRPAGARRLPLIVHAAAAGNLKPFRDATSSRGPSPLAEGLYLSVTCAESFGAFNYERAAREARATRFGDYRLRRQRQACRGWPKRAPPADHFKPVASESEVLLLAGRLDPVAPPEWAREIARGMTNGRMLVFQHGGHLLDGLSGMNSCFDPLMVRFYEMDDVGSLDASCIAEMKPPPFATAELSGAPAA